MSLNLTSPKRKFLTHERSIDLNFNGKFQKIVDLQLVSCGVFVALLQGFKGVFKGIQVFTGNCASVVCKISLSVNSVSTISRNKTTRLKCTVFEEP